jgi:hypothetical protein
MRRRPRPVRPPQYGVTRSQDLAVSSRIRAQASCAALCKGQRARKLITGPDDGGGSTGTAGGAVPSRRTFLVALARIVSVSTLWYQAQVPPWPNVLLYPRTSQARKP